VDFGEELEGVDCLGLYVSLNIEYMGVVGGGCETNFNPIKEGVVDF